MNKNIKKFDENYVLLEEMFEDDYYPKFLVEKVEKLIRNVIEFLETGENDVEIVQKKLDEMTIGINDLEDEFYENESYFGGSIGVCADQGSRAVHGEVHAGIKRCGSGKRHNRHETFHQHTAVTDHADVGFVFQHFRRSTGRNQRVEA